MEDITGAALARHVRGALGVEVTDAGVVISRLPRWTKSQYASGSTIAAVARGCSGVRIEFVSAAGLLELDASFESGEPLDFRHLIVVTAGGVTIDRTIAAGRPGEQNHASAATRLIFVLGPEATPRKITIWLPQGAATTLHRIRSDAELVDDVSLRHRWIHYGSSISDSIGVSGPLEVWPVAVANNLGLDILNLGLSGNAHIDPFVARAVRDTNADLISLKLGVNVVNHASMNIRTFTSAVHGFIDLIREGHPRTPLILISPIYCPPHEQRAGPTVYDDRGTARAMDRDGVPGRDSLTIARIRDVLHEIVVTRSAQDASLAYMDGLELLGPGDGEHLVDRLHPDPAGYRLIATRFARLLEQSTTFTTLSRR